MNKQPLSNGLIHAATPVGTHDRYMPGFGNDFETEAGGVHTSPDKVAFERVSI